jgi:hypothetical protein
MSVCSKCGTNLKVVESYDRREKVTQAKTRCPNHLCDNSRRWMPSYRSNMKAEIFSEGKPTYRPSLLTNAIPWTDLVQGWQNLCQDALKTAGLTPGVPATAAPPPSEDYTRIEKGVIWVGLLQRPQPRSGNEDHYPQKGVVWVGLFGTDGQEIAAPHYRRKKMLLPSCERTVLGGQALDLKFLAEGDMSVNSFGLWSICEGGQPFFRSFVYDSNPHKFPSLLTACNGCTVCSRVFVDNTCLEKAGIL